MSILTFKDCAMSQEGRLPEPVYHMILQSLVILCADIVVVDRTRKMICLAPRTTEPCRGWWLIGGRQMRGQTSQEAAVEHFEMDTGIRADGDRFQFVANCEYIQPKNAQDIPGGTHTFAPTYAIELTPEELAHLGTTPLRQGEYAGRMRWFQREDLIVEVARGEAFRAIVPIYDKIFPSL